MSLNDALLVGPTLQDGLIPLLLRFRCHQVALTADITKMYRQIRIEMPDADFQRIVWRDSPRDPIKEYRLLTVTYGTASAPYLATKCLQQLAHDEDQISSTARNVLLRDFYVDDLMSGAETVDRAMKLKIELIELLRRGGFELRKWSSNCTEVLQSVPLSCQSPAISLQMGVDETIKALGIHWHPTADYFAFKVTPPDADAKPTKRQVLSYIAKLFDPLGWVAPIVIKAKILLQALWKINLEWDDVIPASQVAEWSIYINELRCIETIRIPRCVTYPNSMYHQLHAFCDASEKAYAAAIYLKTFGPGYQVKVCLLASKTRVAPIKSVSLPRLELCAAVILVRLLKLVKDSLSIHINEIHGWTDSTIVLAWLASIPSRWKTFVANRVAEIQAVLPRDQWHHVASRDNPADCASRGLLPSELASHHLWWTGPPWLQTSIYPQTVSSADVETVVAEERTKSLVCEVNISTTPDSLSLLHRYSSLTKLTRVTAYCLRFIANCKQKRENRNVDYLNAQELDCALLQWIKNVQATEFEPEISCLKGGRELHRKSQILSLNPFLGKDDLLRVGGRLRNADIPEDRKHPILLPRRHVLTQLIVSHFHLRNFHAGPQLLLATIQDRYWIPCGRDVVRQHVRKCITCYRHRAEAASQMMGDLPKDRVCRTRPFQKCGVDYAGPFKLLMHRGRGQKSYKGYLALFICFTTRAIHLELVSDLSTESFIAALKRFIARRGKCSDLFSDCGTNFVGANKELKQFMKFVSSKSTNDQVSYFLSSEGVNWHFNPPASPHMGGLWEAGIKSTKYHLTRIVGNASLTFEEMYTVLTQVEACLNSRPLCQLSSNPSDLSALTPGHFLIGGPLNALPEPDYTDVKENRLSRWQMTQRHVQHFWSRWSREYLSRLQQRPKWLSKKENIQLGDLVLIKEDNLPPLKWRLGRITHLHPGPDDCVRVVSLRTESGELKRPIAKICRLPID